MHMYVYVCMYLYVCARISLLACHFFFSFFVYYLRQAVTESVLRQGVHVMYSEIDSCHDNSFPFNMKVW